MGQQPSRERAPHDGSAAPPGDAGRGGTKRDPKALTLVGAGMLTIVASVITLFVDKLSLPLYASLMIGLIGIGLAGAALIMQLVPEHWTRPVGAVGLGIAVLVVLTFFLTPRKSETPLEAASQGPSGVTLALVPDRGQPDTTFFVSGNCPRRGGEIHIYFDGKDLFTPATCLADHTYRTSYRPDQDGRLTWFDGSGKRHLLTLSTGSTYMIYAQTTYGDAVSHRVKYRVG